MDEKFIKNALNSENSGEILGSKRLGILENLDDLFIKAIYNDLCQNGKIMLKSALFSENLEDFRVLAKRLGFLDTAVQMGEFLITTKSLKNGINFKNKEQIRLLYIYTYVDSGENLREIYENLVKNSLF